MLAFYLLLIAFFNIGFTSAAKGYTLSFQRWTHDCQVMIFDYTTPPGKKSGVTQFTINSGGGTSADTGYLETIQTKTGKGVWMISIAKVVSNAELQQPKDYGTTLPENTRWKIGPLVQNGPIPKASDPGVSPMWKSSDLQKVAQGKWKKKSCPGTV
ncbi:hypothetical protein T439DRAFT_384349 [Meredithblackwellia eburnea MCA 4105]